VWNRVGPARPEDGLDREGLRRQLDLQLSTNLVFFTTPELLEIGNIPMTSLAEKPGRNEALKYYRRVADHYKLDIHQYERVDPSPFGWRFPGRHYRSLGLSPRIWSTQDRTCHRLL